MSCLNLSRTESKHRASVWMFLAMLSMSIAVTLGCIAVAYHH